MRYPPRRRFLQLGLASGVAALYGCPATLPPPDTPPSPTPPPIDPPVEPPVDPPPETPPRERPPRSGAGNVRRSTAGMGSDSDIMRAYRAAVAAMKQLPASDPRNWERQAAIHANFCPHNNWFFLPWHRAYLYYFEQICQTLNEDPGFALPYWDWAADPRLPAAVTGGADNPLWHPRNLAAGQPLNSMAVSASSLRGILGTSDFGLFAGGASTTQRGASLAGTLESQPHNIVHSIVGGDMAVVPNAGRDPVFWLHHAAVDAYWARWTDGRGGRNSDDARWRDFVFRGNFVDGNGRSVDISVADTLDMHRGRYRYDNTGALATGTAPPTRRLASSRHPVGLCANQEALVALERPAEALQLSALRLRGVSAPPLPQVEIEFLRDGTTEPFATLGLFVGDGEHGAEHEGMDFQVALADPLTLGREERLLIRLKPVSAQGQQQHVKIDHIELQGVA